MLVAVLVSIGSSQASATPAQATLTATVGPGFTISLADAAGAAVSTLAPGTYRITVRDRSASHNFHLSGPGVDRATGVAEVGTTMWTVTLAAGTYRFVCDPHASSMRGSFRVGAASSPPPPQAASEWERVRTGVAPAARRDHALVTDTRTGLVYLFGGRAGGRGLNDVWVFDPKAERWRELKPRGGARPAGRWTPNAAWDAPRKRLVVSLGQSPSGFFSDAWAFNPATRRWSRLAASGARPEARYGAAAGHDARAGHLYVSHGFTDKGRFDDTWRLDLRRGRWQQVTVRGTRPVKRCLGLGFWDAAGKRLYIYAGQTDGTPFLGDLWSLNPATGRWTSHRAAGGPGARNLYGAAVDRGGRFVVVGGNTARGPVADTWALDPRTRRWTRLAAGLPARQSPGVAVTGSTLVVFGGAGASGDELADTWVLSLAR